MRRIIKSLVWIVVIAVPLLYYLPPLGGYPPFYPLGAINIKQVLRTLQQDIKAQLPRADSKAVRIYRWQDKSGQWHYSSTPPQEGVAYEEHRVDPDTNLIPGTSDGEQESSMGTSAADNAAGNGKTPSPYPLEGMEKIMERAREAGPITEQRQKALQQTGEE